MMSRTFLITGGTGSFGSQAVETLLQRGVKELIVFARDEFKHYLLAERWPEADWPIRYFVGDVRDKERLWRALEGVEWVIHAAAMKQVPTCEYNPIEAIKTNVLGAQNLIECAIDRGVERVMALGTDKQVNPINLYGATKLCAEKLFMAANAYGGGKVKFSVVRYGNVMASRGSVVPYFQELAAKNESIPITDPDMTRFWITLPEAVNFVLERLDDMQGGEIFIPKLPSVNICSLAYAIKPNCEMHVSGIRPGEKMHETLISKDESRHVIDNGSYFAIIPEKTGTVVDGFEYRSDTNKWTLKARELRRVLEGKGIAQE